MVEQSGGSYGDDAIRAKSRFHEALSELIREADENDIGVEGGWLVDDEDGHRDWEVEIVKLAE